MAGMKRFPETVVFNATLGLSYKVRRRSALGRTSRFALAPELIGD
jgi:hypothetical protein